MIENTIENKSVFFARYYLQPVYNNRNYPDAKPNQILDSTLISYTDKAEFLQLTPLSMITDEHAIEVAKILGIDDIEAFYDWKNHIIELISEKNAISANSMVLFFRVCFFLISKGYYVGDGTEINYGWAVLKTE